MPDTVKYGMGQLRYSSNTPYMTNLNFTFAPQKVEVLSNDNLADTNTMYYQDILLKSPNSSFSFSMGTSYLLRITIPKDTTYNNVYRLKLISEQTGTSIPSSLRDYQIIKYIEVPKDTYTAWNTSRVVLYPIEKNTQDIIPWTGQGEYITKVAIAKTLNDNPGNNDIVYDESSGKYYVYVPTTNTENPFINSKFIGNKNDQLMGHPWNTQSIDTETVTFDVVFSPRSRDETYTSIWVEIYRENYDVDIYNNEIYGRQVNLNQFSASVYQLTNLISTDFMRHTPIYHMGIHSHPNLIMAINGEEIRVGQTGYYELNDFEVTSLGIVADDNADKFTLDYQYKIDD